MGPARAGLASCMVQLKLRFSPIRLGLNLIESVPVTITYAWLAIQSNNSDLLTSPGNNSPYCSAIDCITGLLP